MTLLYSLPDSNISLEPWETDFKEKAGLEISIRESSAKVVAESVESNIIYHLLTAYYVSGGVINNITHILILIKKTLKLYYLHFTNDETEMQKKIGDVLFL